MDCTHIQSKFTAATDQELDAVTMGRFQEHLAGCGHCRQEWRYFQKTLHHLQGLEPLPTPTGILAGIHAKLEHPTLGRGILNIWRQLDFSMSLPAATATVAAALAVAVFFKAAPIEGPLSQPDRQAEVTGPSISLPGAQKPLANHLLPAPQLATNAYHRSLPLALQTFPAHPPAFRRLRPDVLITLRQPGSAAIAALSREITARKDWRTQRSGELLMIRLPGAQLPILRHMLSQHNVTVSPPEALSPRFGDQRQQLLVAVRLQ